MAERQKGKPFAFGGKTTTTVTHTNTTDFQAMVVVIESVAPTQTADKVEFKDGNGDVNGLIYTNTRTSLDVEFYVSETNISTSEARDKRAFAPGDSLTFDDTGFPEIDDASHAFIIDEITKTRNFGEARKISLRMMEYANNVTADAS